MPLGWSFLRQANPKLGLKLKEKGKIKLLNDLPHEISRMDKCVMLNFSSDSHIFPWMKCDFLQVHRSIYLHVDHLACAQGWDIVVCGHSLYVVWWVGDLSWKCCMQVNQQLPVSSSTGIVQVEPFCPADCRRRQGSGSDGRLSSTSC